MIRKNHRNFIQCQIDILTYLNDNKDKNLKINATKILYKCNFAYQQMKEYLDNLSNKNLIIFIKGNYNTLGKCKGYYKITQKGVNFINEYKKVFELMNIMKNDNII